MGYAPSRLQQVAGDDGARGVVGGGDAVGGGRGSPLRGVRGQGRGIGPGRGLHRAAGRFVAYEGVL